MGRKIVVIDDEKLLLGAIERALSKVGYEVFAVTSLKALRGVIAHAPFDLLITDINLVDDNADEVIDLVRLTSPAARVLLMSGSIDTYQCYSFIEKPFTISGLRQKVKEMLDGA